MGKSRILSASIFSISLNAKYEMPLKIALDRILTYPIPLSIQNYPLCFSGSTL